jgi:hypothetical protein
MASEDTDNRQVACEGSITAYLPRSTVQADRRIRRKAGDQNPRWINWAGECHGVVRQPGKAERAVIGLVTDEQHEAVALNGKFWRPTFRCR